MNSIFDINIGLWSIIKPILPNKMPIIGGSIKKTQQISNSSLIIVCMCCAMLIMYLVLKR